MTNSRFSAAMARIKQCPGNEHEQGYLRFFLVSSISLYIYVLAAHPQIAFDVRDKDTVRQAISVIYPIFAVYAVGFFYWLYRMPVEVPARRIVSNFVDLSSLSIVMHLSDEWGSVLYPVYLWISIGSAFRFGSPYLLISAVFSILMFAVVIFTTPFWAAHMTISVGLLLGLFILPPYIGLLLRQKGDALRKAEIANSYKARFLAAISHELRTPLHSIIALSELSLKDTHRDSAHDYMRQVSSAGQHLLSLIDDILDLSKIENAKLQLSRVPFDLHETVAAVKTLALPQAESKQLLFKLDVADNVPDSVIGDELRIRQILINLVSNAVKYTEAGEIVLAVRVLDLSLRSVRLQFYVEDTGVGIKDDDIEKVFQSFVQVHHDGKPRAGSGLGLAITRQLVELMGGEIVVTSEFGKGSRFAFDIELPLISAFGLRDSRQAKEDSVSKDLSGLSILIAEDDALSQFVYKQIFETRRCQLTIVDNGEEALQALRTRQFDLALLDNQMPLLNGLEVASIWRREETGRRMPIIVLTADAVLANQEERSVDIELIRTKPITPADLIKEIGHLSGGVS